MDLSTITSPEKYRRFIPKAVPPGTSTINVAPVAHFTMGGVSVKPGGGTEIPRLWAIGEVAGGMHGANRIGGNALAECLAMGRAAGRAASECARGLNHSMKLPEKAYFLPEITANGTGRPELEALLRRTMSRQAGVLRNAEGLEEGLAWINSLKDSLARKNAGAGKSAAEFRMELMLDVAGAICLCALMRRESRGSHYRTDYPAESGEYLGNFLVRKVKGELEIKFQPLA
jgi:aspartate oxidase